MLKGFLGPEQTAVHTIALALYEVGDLEKCVVSSALDVDIARREALIALADFVTMIRLACEQLLDCSFLIRLVAARLEDIPTAVSSLYSGLAKLSWYAIHLWHQPYKLETYKTPVKTVIDRLLFAARSLGLLLGSSWDVILRDGEERFRERMRDVAGWRCKTVE